MNSRLGQLLWVLLPSFLLLIWAGMQVDVMEVDSAQYASIAREMLHNGSWLEIYEHNQTYNSKGFPDKPPLVFWTGAAGMWLFGENNFGFKFFSVIAALIGIYSVSRWAQLLYGQVAKVPAMLFAGLNVGMLLMLQDIRTDTLLVGMLALSIWQLETYFRSSSKAAFILAFVALALAMLAKGPIALVALIAAFGGDILVRGDWQRLFRKEWLLGLAIVLLLLSPMLYGLYHQWGWEKGIKYYFWTQSFGRITGENVWKNDLGPLFLVETYLWAYLPWVPLLLLAIWATIRQKASFFRRAGGWVAPFGFVLLFVAMSTSQYKLPHYIYIVWPFAAVWLTGWWVQLQNKSIAQNLLAALTLVLFAVSAMVLFHFSEANIGWGALLSLAFILMAWFYWKSADTDLKLFGPASMSLLYFGMVANFWFYPKLTTYQAPSIGGKFLHELPVHQPVFIYEIADESIHSLHFYAGMVLPRIWKLTELLPNTSSVIYTTRIGFQKAQRSGVQLKVLAELPFHSSTQLTSRFLNPATREETLEKHYILLVSP
jgi:4-amino-4-deoxy-L-arabinose transferase-like glycosyltransferase